jgi:tetratricopeptide (TPR) repeat protein
LYAPWLPKGIDHRRVLEHTTVPYFSYWSFGEQLAVISERTSNPDLVSYYFETHSALLTYHLDRAELLVESRDQYVQAARRLTKTREVTYGVYLSWTPELAKLGEALERSLERRGVRVVAHKEPSADAEWPSELVSFSEDSRFLVPLIGQESAKSRWQQAEIRTFISASIDPTSPRTITPIVVEPSALDTLPALFRSLRFIDGKMEPEQIASQLVASMRADAPEWEPALEVIEEAVRRYRTLAQGNPDAFLPDLADALNNLSARLGDLGRREEALAAAEQAVAIRRLAEANPHGFLPFR